MVSSDGLVLLLPLLLLLLLVQLGGSESADAPYVLVPADAHDAGHAADITFSILHGAGNVNGHPAPPGVDGYRAVVSNAAPHFRSFGPLGGKPCGKRVKTSVTARSHKCKLATNAGPFDMSNGACNGGVFITNGQVQGTGGYRSQFGVTADGKWVIGNLVNASVAAQLKVMWSIPGFSWLVRDGKNAMTKPDTYIAPRTTIGVTKEGKLLIIEVDGCEPHAGCKYTIGKTCYHMAELLLKHGAWHAINLDGGGSSSIVVNGSVVNHPTDTDLWALRKERAVTVISCVV
eukprot:COSAG01_NODE_13777_length_1537_cov_1.367872_1_plen_288_part_00